MTRDQIIEKVEMLLEMARSQHSGKRDIEGQLQLLLAQLRREP